MGFCTLGSVENSKFVGFCTLGSMENSKCVGFCTLGSVENSVYGILYLGFSGELSVRDSVPWVCGELKVCGILYLRF